MTVEEFTDRFFSSPTVDTPECRLFARILLLKLAEYWGELPPMDSVTRLRQLGDSAIRQTALLSRRFAPDPVCPHCFHEHEGPHECGKYLGEMKCCHCTSKVPA